MKNLIYFITCLFIFGCGLIEKRTEANQKTEKSQVEKTNIDTSKFTIIPFDSSNKWIFENAKATELTDKELRTIERLLNACINEYNPEQEQKFNELNKEHPEYELKLKHFVIELDHYGRQYIPIMNENREKEVWINCFCGNWEKNDRTNIIIVEDGGNCYFNLKINLTKEKYYDLIVNGNA